MYGPILCIVHVGNQDARILLKLEWTAFLSVCKNRFTGKFGRHCKPVPPSPGSFLRNGAPFGKMQRRFCWRFVAGCPFAVGLSYTFSLTLHSILHPKTRVSTVIFLHRCRMCRRFCKKYCGGAGTLPPCAALRLRVAPYILRKSSVLSAESAAESANSAAVFSVFRGTVGGLCAIKGQRRIC